MTLKLLKILCFCLFLFSCGKEEERKEPQPDPLVKEVSVLSLEKADFSKLNNWKTDNLKDAVSAFKLSCDKMRFIQTEYIGNSEIKIPTKEYLANCSSLKMVSEKEYRQFFENNFTPYLVKYNNSSQGKFTSYYESALRASYHKSDKYRYPIYGRPNDMIEINLQDFDKSFPNKRFVGRIKDKKLIPYFTRDEIEQNKIDAPVILWADSHIDIYVMQIQGSAVATLEDGTRIRIGYAENNGREFKGIGSILLENGLLNPGKASMGHIKRWLKENINISDKYMNKNQRFIFHRLIDAPGPLGAQGVPLTSGRSLAVDRSFIPLGSLLWIETQGPYKEKIEKLVVAQDIGGAIKGAVRGDYFWGSGEDDILELAGRMNATGQYYILLPNTIKVTQ